MTRYSSAHILIASEAAKQFACEAFRKVGLSQDSANSVANLMIEADLSGAAAHGIFRLSQYVNRIKLGAINPQPDIRVERTAAATAIVDGDNGMGHLAVAQAVKTAVEQAQESGVAWVGVHNSNHAGAAGVYATMIAAEGMIGIYSAVASANHMGAWGGAEPLLGTNPLAIAIPCEGWPAVLDVATSVVSYGTIKNYRLQKRRIPVGWMIDPNSGADLVEPDETAGGLLLPVGGYKGAGLALMLGLLAGTLNGAPFGKKVVDFNQSPERVCDTGQFVVALDVSRFAPLAEFMASASSDLDGLRKSRRLPGIEEIRLPGDERYRRRQGQLREGLALTSELISQLKELARDLDIRPLG
jgi:L-2-hydroxycarboxylate dehydrogenase (NAD+)